MTSNKSSPVKPQSCKIIFILLNAGMTLALLPDHAGDDPYADYGGPDDLVW